MSANEDYLDSLLKSMNDEKAEEPDAGKAASMMSLDEIEAMFAAAEKAASGDLEQEIKEPEQPIEEPTEYEAKQPIEEPAEYDAEQPIEEPAEYEAEQPVEEPAEYEAEQPIEEPAEYDAEQPIEESAEYEPEEILDLSEELPVEEAALAEDTSEAGNGETEEEDPIWKMLAGLDETAEIPGVDSEAGGKETILEELPEEDSEDILSLLDQQDISPLMQEGDNPFGEAAGQAAAEENNIPDYAGLFGEAEKELTAANGNEAAQPDKKKGKVKNFFRNLLDRMTEEDEPEDGLSEENRTVMEELDAEDRAAAGKKKKKKKGKMPAGEKEEAEEDQADERGKKTGKEKKKPAKAKKTKPEKKLREIVPEEAEKPTRRISPKSIAVVILFALTIFAIVYFGGNLFSTSLQKSAAKKAFEVQDYLTCYESLYGISLSEEEKEMYTHAETVLRMERRITVYEGYLKEGRELEALDSLMRVIAGYEELFTTARECGAAAEVEALYQEVLRILQDKYGVSETDARAIVSSRSNVDYTRYLTALTEGGEFSVGDGEGLSLPREELTDLLPLETELEQNLQEQGGLTE